MLIQPIDVFVYAWLAIAVLSAAYVAWDQFRNNPEPVVMKWGFVLVTLYMGPLGLLLYVLADKEPRPGEHEKFIQPLWKQGVGSTIHCVAGDATGIILAAVITASLGLPMWIDLIVEYTTGFSIGLFIFQSLFMKSMMGGTYWENVRKSFVPEFISMNFMMGGMAPVMSFLMMGRDMRAMEPTELLFWGVMSIGVIAGFFIAYPANVWMVNSGLKHGLMTERKERKSGEPHEGLDSHGSKHEGQTEGHGAKQDSGHRMNALVTTPQLTAVGGVSVLALALGMVAPANWLNLRLSAREVGGAIMPPGMIIVRDTPAEAMIDMAAVSPRDVRATYGLEVNGNRAMVPRIENGVKVFDLETSVIRWTILPGVTVDAYAFNGQIPGPLLRFRQGDTVRTNVT